MVTSGSPFDTAFRELILQSGRASRRDFLRATGILAASGVAAGALPSGAFARQTPPPVEGSSLTLPFNPYGQSVTVDPHRTVNWGPFWVMIPYAWSGLLRFDQNGAVVPDLAESVTPNDDGSVWTATLKPNIAYANGDPVLASHFITSWMRALSSTALSPMSSFFAPIMGYDDIIAGNNVALGVTALNDTTLEITLKQPVANFDSWLATFGYAVMHPAYIDPSTADAQVSLDGASAGPWKIVAFDEQSAIWMQPNEHYQTDAPPAVAQIEWRIAPGGNTDRTLLDWYSAGEIAVCDVPEPLLEEVSADTALAEHLATVEPSGTVLTLALDFHSPPFNDVRVRRAIAAAINRETWASDIKLQTYAAANSFSPPVLATIAAYTAPTDAYDDNVADLLSAAQIDPTQMEDEIILFQPATDSDQAIADVDALLKMVQEATGIQITHDTTLTSEQITAMRQDAGGLQASLMEWQLDSATPSLLNVAGQDSPWNAGFFNWEPGIEAAGDYDPGADATAFDDLVAKAAANLDETSRNEQYAEAEALLLKNAVLIPIGFRTPRYLQQPWLTGTAQGAFSGSLPVAIDGNVQVDESQRTSTPAS